MLLIPLTQQKFSKVDDDCAWLNQWRWFTVRNKNTFYAARQRRGRLVLMHREILPGRSRIDHKDGDGLNNQRENIRRATNSQNQANRGLSRANTSGLKGVNWRKDVKKWTARVMRDGKSMHLGFFLSAEEAARAYDKAALKFFGKFARPNFPEENCCTNARPSVSCDSE